MKRKYFSIQNKSLKKLTAAALALCVALGLSACGQEIPLELAGRLGQGEDGGNDNGEEGTDQGQSAGAGQEDSGADWETVSANVKNLMQGITAGTVSIDENKTEQNTDEVADFAVRLLQNSMAEDQKEGKNTLISPMSVLYALAMTANGAKENTLRQMEGVFGLSVDELNDYLYKYYRALPSAEKYKVSLANSIWFTEERNFTADPGFLQTNADYYDADLFETVFDENAKQAINAWVRERTAGMIPEIVDEIPKDAIMYLINAVSFDAEWQNIYNESQIWDREFTTASGEKENVKFMYSEEYTYLEDENAVGFLKYYAENKYAFAALLPAEGITVEEYVKLLTGEKLQQIFANAQQTAVDAGLPKFTCESGYTMNSMLMAMGMSDAFDGDLADFTGMGTVPEGYNICIGRVLHKAKIEVDERGTKAGAATVVEMKNYATAIRETKVVTLDRPFIYMIIDCETKLPMFIGTVKTVNP